MASHYGSSATGTSTGDEWFTSLPVYRDTRSDSPKVSAIEVAQDVMAAQSRKSPNGFLTRLLIDHFSMKFILSGLIKP
jgi:hypothetical protein